MPQDANPDYYFYDPYLVQFVDQFTAANGGKAFYSSLQGLGEFIFMDYKQQKRNKKQ